MLSMRGRGLGGSVVPMRVLTYNVRGLGGGEKRNGWFT